MIGKLFKIALDTIKVPFAIIEDAGDVLLSGESEGKTMDSLEELADDFEDLIDPFDV